MESASAKIGYRHADAEGRRNVRDLSLLMPTICLFDYRFRWVYCQLEALRGCCYSQTLRRTLEELPKTLDATYERTLLNIDKGKQKYPCRLFRFSASPFPSVRPLRGR